jgi:hypothetical protein
MIVHVFVHIMYHNEYILYSHNNTNVNNSVKKNVNFIYSFQNEGSSPSCIALSFDEFGSISCQSIWFFRLFYSFHTFWDFQVFQPEYHWRDLISRNVHVVHQNWYPISFTNKWKYHKLWHTNEKCQAAIMSLQRINKVQIWLTRQLYQKTGFFW